MDFTSIQGLKNFTEKQERQNGENNVICLSKNHTENTQNRRFMNKSDKRKLQSFEKEATKRGGYLVDCTTKAFLQWCDVKNVAPIYDITHKCVM